jgi:type II secretory pathway component PulF
MKNDEFAFFNQQLAAMVRDGIPLESALRRLCADMRDKKTRAELEKLGDDLARGIPLRDAVQARRLPELYQRMLEVGTQTNDLPGVLTMLADHYQRSYVVTARLKGLMIYPAIVLFASFMLSVFLSYLMKTLDLSSMASWMGGSTEFISIATWISPFMLAFFILGIVSVLIIPRTRRALRWWLPAFKEASLAQAASALAMMLKSGVPLNNALILMEKLEAGTPAEIELARWRQRLANGQGNFSQMAADGKVFPPLFVWTVSQAHEDMTTGFQRAAEFYQSRARHRTDALLYLALPCSVMALGVLIILQVQPAIMIFVRLMDSLGDMSGKS